MLGLEWLPYFTIPVSTQALSFTPTFRNRIEGCKGCPRVFITPTNGLSLFYQGLDGMYRAITYDGIHWMTESRKAVIPSVRDIAIIYLRSGGYRFICDIHGRGKDLFQSYYTLDGWNFQHEGTCGPDHRANGGWCDVPHAVQLEGTIWRLYYVGGPTLPQVVIRSAISYDEGKTFTYEGPVFSSPARVDPDALYLPNGKFRLYYMHAGYTVCAADGDGRRFTDTTVVAKSASDILYDPTVVRIPQTGKYLLYYGIPQVGIGVMAS